MCNDRMESVRDGCEQCTEITPLQSATRGAKMYIAYPCTGSFTGLAETYCLALQIGELHGRGR